VSAPRLSVVIPAVSGPVVAGACEAALRRLAGVDDVEVIVVAARPGATLCQLRAEGVRQATAPNIAILGDRYQVTPGWLEVATSPARFDAAGGCVSPSPRLGYFGWCVYLSEYAQLSPPISAGGTFDPRVLPGGNTVYRAAVLDADQLAACATELPFHAAFLASGHSAGQVGELEVVLASTPGVGEFVRERFRFSYDIARERKQPLRLFLSPLLPFAVLARTASSTILRRRFAWRWLACAPVIFALGVVQAAGDLLGHAAAGMSS